MCVLLYYYYKTSSLQACYPHTITLIIHLFLTIQCYRVSINTATTNTTWSSSCILYIQIQIYVIYTTTKSTEHCLQQHCISNINYVDQSVFWHIVFSMVFYLLHEQNKSTMSFSHLVAIIIMSYLNFWASCNPSRNGTHTSQTILFLDLSIAVKNNKYNQQIRITTNNWRRKKQLPYLQPTNATDKLSSTTVKATKHNKKD